MYVQAHRNPLTNGLAGFTVTTTADRGCTVHYEIDGAAQTPVVVAANDTAYVPLDALSITTVNRLELHPDN